MIRKFRKTFTATLAASEVLTLTLTALEGFAATLTLPALAATVLALGPASQAATVLLPSGATAQTRDLNSLPEDYYIVRGVLNNGRIPFISHKGENRFDSYLALNVRFAPMADLFRQLLNNERKQLTNRGEAHITVITPVEFFDQLKSHISMEEIELLARRKRLQWTKFKIICLGKGVAEIGKELKLEETYYLVVESENLLELRRLIHTEFVKNGGNPAAFDPDHYFPHITLGFTSRDLHEDDGVQKDVNTCVSRVAIP